MTKVTNPLIAKMYESMKGTPANGPDPSMGQHGGPNSQDEKENKDSNKGPEIEEVD